eukprot:TRINITY_DN33419_c0_g1_i1.p1 TRINITY_DN33419_c0_g1~~TRINITY_DN33419_c0_g1_i1.p1  ORF type:complete len:830 (+),score=187.51 TRINITY_DN33419_c0_g1_i1:83-2491(+)
MVGRPRDVAALALPLLVPRLAPLRRMPPLALWTVLALLALSLPCAAKPSGLRGVADDGEARPRPCASSTSIPERVDCLLRLMTVEEKAGQLGVFSRVGGSDFNPRTGSLDWNRTVGLIRSGQVGALYNGAGVKTNRRLQRVAVEESRLGIPLIFGADVWHGMNTVFPIPLAEASSFEPDLAERTARATAVEATAAGLMWTFAPMVDTARDQRWGRVAEGAGEDVFLNEAFARSRVRGYQGADLADETSLAACLKHFAGYGAVAAGLDYSAADVSEATLRDVFLPPFRAGIEAGAATVMSAFVSIVNGVPASGSHWLMTEVLRNELNFSGFVVSDYEADLELVEHGFAADAADAARLALTAGVDMSMQSGIYRDHLPRLLGEGLVSSAVLDEAARRVLMVKARMGLLDNPYRSLDLAREARDRHVPAHDKLAREAAVRSQVLLRNKGDLLPLPKKGKKVALIGWWASDKLNEEGVGVVWGNRTHAVTLQDGVRAAIGDELHAVVEGSGADYGIDGGIAAAKAAAEAADVVLLALGEPTHYTGEANSRTSITIPEAQQQLAEAVAAAGTPVVIVLKNGRALALEGAVRDADAILVTWFLGKEAGHAIADILFGDESPSGRLPVSFPFASGQEPFFYNHASSGRPCVANDPAWRNCWLRYSNDAMYPFGHGLTYTRFDYGTPELMPSALLPWDGSLNITMTLRNIGARAGEEVAQLYVRDLVASRVRPVRELKGFRKVSLRPGQSAEITFTLTRQDLAFSPAWPPGKPVAEPGSFEVWVAPSSAAISEHGVLFELLPEGVSSGEL